jgi:dTDP-4-dehydrorhamnose reductase
LVYSREAHSLAAYRFIMRFFITGAGGQLALSVSSVFREGELFLASKNDLDVQNKKEVIEKISGFKPDIVFHLASLTRGDECAKNPDLAEKINVQGTENVIEACLLNDAALLFISTNEVFDGKEHRKYSENDVPNPITIAGKTKYLAEKLIIDRMTKYFIVRTSWLYGEWAKNFLHAILKKASESRELEVVEDEVSSPTYSMDLAIAVKKLVSMGKYGLYHLSNKGYASRFDFANKAFEILKIKDCRLMPIKLSKYKRISKPPLYTPLENTRAAALGITMPDWQDALRRFLNNNKV